MSGWNHDPFDYDEEADRDLDRRIQDEIDNRWRNPPPPSRPEDSYERRRRERDEEPLPNDPYSPF